MLSPLHWLNTFIVLLDLQVLNKLPTNANALISEFFCFVCQEIQQNLF